RVPMLVISPFSRGGHIASEVFDHTSQLKLISARFGIQVPNVSTWRRKTVGDLTSTMFCSRPDTKVPKLPPPAIYMPASGSCSSTSQQSEVGGAGPSVPTKQRMPVQGGGSEPASKYYPAGGKQAAVPDDHRTPLNFVTPGPQTTKSQHNKLALLP